MTKKVNKGKEFEESWKASMIKDKLWQMRIKDSPLAFRREKVESLYTPENPYDFLCFYSPDLFCFELKSTKYNSMSIQIDKEETNSKKMIKYHQIKSLTEASAYDHVFAGLVLNFYNESEQSCTFYLPISNFLRFLAISHKHSINLNEVIAYGGIQVSQHLLRIKYHYQIKELLEKLQKGDK